MTVTSINIPRQLRPLLWICAYWAIMKWLGGINFDTIAAGVVILGLYYASRPSRALIGYTYPIFATAMIYDSMRYYADSIRSDYIRVQEPYLFDKTLFGIQTAQGVLTPNEWWQLHTHWSLDLVTGFFYLTFVAIFVMMGLYFRFAPRFRDNFKSIAASTRMIWAFFWVNLLGYSTYYWYPAAPPWYVALKGLGPADLSVGANPAGCIRFDQLLGTHFFTGMYGKSADVFGAIPSLHVAYPFLAMLYAWELGSLRAFGTFFYLIMCFAAVYLDHHYVLDILWGSAYSLIIYYGLRLHNNYRETGSFTLR